MLDFTELPADGVRFEQLIREILVRSGFEVHWTGTGPDGGRDLVAIERAPGPLAQFERRWLVSCKHYAGSGRSVGLDDVTDIYDACAAVDARGFLLACSTQPSSTMVRRLEEIEANRSIVTRYWDSTRPSFWAANYKDYFLYLGSRTSNLFPKLRDVEEIVARLESVKLLKGEDWNEHYLRRRGIYFDDKHEQYSVFADYLFPQGKEKKTLTPQQIDAVLKGGQGLYSDKQSMWKLTFWDIPQHLAEVIVDTETKHNPHHMLERAIGVAAVCMRRQIECRLVTDKFRHSQLAVHNFRMKAGIEWREPFVSRMASVIFNNYDMKARYPERRTPKMISDRMLHARVIGVLSGSAYLQDGLLIASDIQRRTELFHFTSEEIAAVFDAFLDGRVVYAADGYLDNGEMSGTDKVFASVSPGASPEFLGGAALAIRLVKHTPDHRIKISKDAQNRIGQPIAGER